MKLLIGVILSLMTTVAMAGEFYVIEMDNVLLKSNQGDDTIKLKQELRSQYSGLKLKKSDLLSVVLVAKSRAGKGKVRLAVGGVESAAQTVLGSQQQWNSKKQKSFDRILLENDTNSSQGAWQLRLRGNFKVHQIVVEIAKKKKSIQTSTSSHFGGFGGGQHELACAEGDVLSSLRLRTGALVDNIQAGCKSGLNSGIDWLASFGGNGGGLRQPQTCPNGYIGKGIFGRSGALIDSLGLICENPNTGDVRRTVAHGGNGGGAFAHMCEGDLYLVSLTVRTGALVDAVQAHCSTL
ncbi:MAG: hypothetical protein HRT44_10955 [Bdellovibrionales bacterium]|nr:hypothetical protein [Bdellovibrionales bacterium]NQZ19759.1 hypothetical protein [Bdellovibrionales bacterium]